LFIDEFLSFPPPSVAAPTFALWSTCVYTTVYLYVYRLMRTDRERPGRGTHAFIIYPPSITASYPSNTKYADKLVSLYFTSQV
jgi:hypothetical protein